MAAFELSAGRPVRRSSSSSSSSSSGFSALYIAKLCSWPCLLASIMVCISCRVCTPPVLPHCGWRNAPCSVCSYSTCNLTYGRYLNLCFRNIFLWRQHTSCRKMRKERLSILPRFGPHFGTPTAAPGKRRPAAPCRFSKACGSISLPSARVRYRRRARSGRRPSRLYGRRSRRRCPQFCLQKVERRRLEGRGRPIAEGREQYLRKYVPGKTCRRA